MATNGTFDKELRAPCSYKRKFLSCGVKILHWKVYKLSLDGFLTFIGLMIAAYAVLNPISQLRLQLRVRQQIFVGLLFFGTVIFFAYFDELKYLCSGSPAWLFDFFTFGQQDNILSNNKAAFLVVLLWMVTAVYLYKTAKPKVSDLGTLAKLVERLHDEGRYLEIIELTSPYIPLIAQANEKKLAIQQIHEWILRENLYATNKFAAEFGSETNILPKGIAKRIKPLARVVPSRKRATKNAQKVLNILVESNEIRKILLLMRVEFALLLIEQERTSYGQFTENYLRELFATSGSEIYAEIKNNQNLEGSIGYYLNPDNTLIFGLLSNLKLASQLSIWKPIGDEALRLTSRDKNYQARLNEVPPFNEDDRFDDPIFATIFFFDIMVTTAARQGHKDHMWLMYMSELIRELENSTDLNVAEIDINAEFPTFGCRAIYEAFSVLRKWVELANDLPPASPLVSIEALSGHPSFSIPRWATIALCRSIRIIVRSERLPPQFQAYQYEIFLKTVNSLPKEGPLSLLREQLIFGAIRGPDRIGEEDLTDVFSKLNNEIDHLALFEADDFKDALEQSPSA